VGRAGQPDQINEPVVALADALRQAGYDGRAIIIADNAALSGMLRTRFPRATVAACPSKASDLAAGRECARQAADASATGWLQISREKLAAPAWWLPGGADDKPRMLELPYLHAHDQQPRVRYYFVWQPRS
jgi:hypothetical protein